MKLPSFKLEEYLSQREFSSTYMFCGSDVESHSMSEILSMADSECLALWNNLTLAYTEPKGAPWLRVEIAETYQASDITDDHVLCLAGAEEGIFCASHTILDSNAHAIVITPCYQSLASIPESICNTTKIQLNYEKRWELDIDEVKDAINPRTKVIVINYPHNPTGAVLSRNSFDELIDVARKQNLWIFSDEVYRGLELNAEDQLPAIADAYEKGISLGVMSKSYGLPGLRIGWIACCDQGLLQKMGALKHYTSICNSAPAEVLSLIALRNNDTIMQRNRNIVAENFKLLDNYFEHHKDYFEWVKPTGGCIAFPKFKVNEEVEVFSDNLLKKTGVVILPGAVYDISGGFFRVGFGRKNMPQALKEFAAFVSG